MIVQFSNGNFLGEDSNGVLIQVPKEKAIKYPHQTLAAMDADWYIDVREWHFTEKPTFEIKED